VTRALFAIVTGLAALGVAVFAIGPSNIQRWLDPVQLPPIPSLTLVDVEPRVIAALTEARISLEANPESAAAWGRFGMVCDIHGFSAEAMACYQAAMQLDPDDPRWPYLLAYQAFLNNEDAARCIELYTRTLKLTPKYFPAMARLGDVYMRVHDYTAARTHFSNAASVGSDQAAVFRRLGQAQLELGQTREAIGSLERAAALAPDDQSTRSALAKAYGAAGDNVRSEAESRQAASSRANAAEMNDPIRNEVVALGASSAILIHRADQYIRKGENDRAVTDLKIALEARPNDAAIHARLGRAYAAMSRRDQAMIHLRTAAQLEPGNAVTRVRLGSILLDLARHEEAVSEFLAAIEVEPNNGATHALLAIALLRSGKAADAILSFERSASMLQPTDIIEFNWGNALMQAGNPPAAVQHYANALALNPNQPDTLFNLGVALEQLGRPNEATSAYQRAVQLNPQHRAKEHLARLSGQ